MISVRSQNTLLHSMTAHFERTIECLRAVRGAGSSPQTQGYYIETMRRIMAAAREINPRYPAMVARIGGKR